MVFNIFLIIFIISLYLVLKSTRFNKDKELLFLRIVFILFFILVASREMTIGNDTSMYLKLFKECSLYKWHLLKTRMYFESGYLVLNILLNYISNDSRFFIVIMSGIFNYFWYKFIKDNSKNYLLSCIMYIGLLFLYTSMTMMRQFTALSILLFSTKFAKGKKLMPFVLLVLFASLFHSSAYIAILYYPIFNMKFSRKKMILVFVIGVLAALSIGSLFDSVANLIGRVNYYSNRVGSNSISNIIYTLIYGIMFVFGLYEVNKKNNNNRNNIENNFYLNSLLFAMVINMLGINMNIMSRVALYFDSLAIVSFPNLIYENINNVNNKKIINSLFIIFFICYSSSIIYLKPEWNSAYNYKSCIFPKENYICK